LFNLFVTITITSVRVGGDEYVEYSFIASACVFIALCTDRKTVFFPIGNLI